MTAERYDAVVVGGGQAGLAVGYHLARHDLSFVILDAGDRPGDSWRSRWDSLRVFTPGRYDGLPGRRFPAPAWSYPTKDEVADFVADYARRFGLPVRSGVRVDRVWRHGDRYLLAAGESRFEAASVVAATGAYHRPRIPDFAGHLDPGIVRLHSSEYRNPAQLQPGAVLVVGAGNSGAEIALDIRRGGHRTWLSGRDTGEELPVRHGGLPDRLLTPPLWFLFSHVLTTRTPAGRALRRKALQVGGHPLARVKRSDLLAAGVERVPRTTGVRDGRPLLADGRLMEVANVVWCTGYRPDFGWLDVPELDEYGAPVHDRGVVSAQPGLYVVGQYFLHGLTSSLIGGVGRDAGHIARHIADRHLRAARHPRATPARGRTAAGRGRARRW
jgi:putative flavoprotein involved in K+ transport